MNLLSFDAQEKLLQLRKHRPTLNLKGNQLQIQVYKVLRKEKEYDLPIDTALLIGDKLIKP